LATGVHFMEAQQGGLQEMKKMILATTMALLASGVTAAGQSRYDDRRYDDRRYDDSRYDSGDRFDDRYDRDGYYAPPPPPPSAAYVRRPVCPGPNYVWIDGFWDWRGRRYAWNPGYWAVRPHARAYWISPRYDRGRYFAGYWGGYRGGPRGYGFGHRR
jgi:hypothetical protein